MKLLGMILTWGSLALGALAAASAYIAPVDGPDALLIGRRHIRMVLETDPNKKDAYREVAEEITAERLAELRQAGVTHIRIQEFEFDLWPGRWYFFLSIVGLVCGAGLSRRAAKAALDAKAKGGAAEGPEQALRGVQMGVEQLRQMLPTLEDRAERLQQIVERLDALEKTDMTAVVDGQDAITARLGLTGLAHFMDAYAVAERQIHRAWSAAADGAYEEAVESLDRSASLLSTARDRLA